MTRDRRAEGVRTIHGFARDAFAGHEIVELTDRRLLCVRPGSGAYGFDVTVLGWGRIVIGGDLEDVVFQGGGGESLLDRLAWLAGSDVGYLREKARRASGHNYWCFDADAFADEIEQEIRDTRARYALDPEDLDEDDDDGDDDEVEADAPKPAPAEPPKPELPKDVAERVEAMEELVADLRTGEMSEGEAYRAAHDIDHELLDGRAGKVYSPTLLWAHEAARAAFLLLQPDAALARFLDAPTRAGLATYNCAVRATRAADARRLAYAREHMAWDVARIRRAG